VKAAGQGCRARLHGNCKSAICTIITVWRPATAANCTACMQFGILLLQFGILPLQFGILPLQFGILPLQFSILPLQFGILPRSLINVSPRTTKQNLDPRCTYVQTRVKMLRIQSRLAFSNGVLLENRVFKYFVFSNYISR
jgi:hypothetical protein